MANDKLLREFINEVLTGFNNMSMGAGGATGNLHADGEGQADSQVLKRNGNVLTDEDQDEDAELQGGPHAACCLILSDDGQVLAVSRKDDPSAFGMPGGKVDPGETAMQAAARELQEETGLTAKKLHKVFVRKEDDGFTCTTFACEPEGQINTEESGVIRWVHPQVLFNGPFGT